MLNGGDVTAPLTPVVPTAGWIVRCHRRTGCDGVAWMPKRPPGVVQTPARLVSELAGDLPDGWVATYWDLHHTRILGQDEQALCARPHYFCSETCRRIGCGPLAEPRHEDDETPCTAWERSTEVPVEVATLIVASAVKQERAEVDAILAARTKECFCAEQDSPCESCWEVSRVRGALKARGMA